MLLFILKMAFPCEDKTYDENSDFYIDLVENSDRYDFFTCNTENSDISILVVDGTDPEFTIAYFFNQRKWQTGTILGEQCFGNIGCEIIDIFYPSVDDSAAPIIDSGDSRKDSGDTALPPPSDPTCGCASSPLFPAFALLPALPLLLRRRRQG